MVTEMTCTGVSGLSPLSVGTLLINITISMPDETFKSQGKRERAGIEVGQVMVCQITLYYIILY